MRKYGLIQTQPQEQASIPLDVAVVEFMATYLILYSTLYVSTQHDIMAQFIGMATTIAYMTCIKDRYYMIPDGSFITTFILYWNTAYTNEQGETEWVEVITRWASQAVAFIAVYFTYAQTTTMHPHITDDWVANCNELVTTAIMATCTAFLLLPILGTYKTSGVFKSKKEAEPPTNETVLRLAFALATLYYCIHRLFNTTMDPFVYLLQYQVQCQTECPPTMTAAQTIGFQLLGLAAACLYTQSYFDGTRLTHVNGESHRSAQYGP